MYRHDDTALTVMDWFCGAGGSSQGAHAVPGLRVERAANHWQRAIESHAANFPETDHYRGDIRQAPVDRWPVCDVFWASPECPQWSVARGKKRDFDATMQGDLFGEMFTPPEEVERSRALMEEVPLYLRGVIARGGLVKAGVVENVIDVRAWDQFDRWRNEFHKLKYRTWIIALNSMHADPRATEMAPQSRDRFYMGYVHQSIGRLPDWDKWLRPRAWCPTCQAWVRAVQSWKRPGVDMGRYRQQYVYRCPNTSCRNQIVEPSVLPAAVAIDWSLPGQRIGDRAKPLAEKTLARIQAGLDKFARPLVVPAGGTWRSDATPATDPMPTRTTRENDGLAVPPFLVPLRSGRNRVIRADSQPLATIVADGGNHGLAVPPLLVPVEGRDGKESSSVNEPLRTQTARNETGLAWLPFMIKLRGGGDQGRALSAFDALGTVSADGNHHAVATPPHLPAALPAMLVRQNTPRGNPGQLCTGVDEPARTLTTAGHQSLVTWEHLLVPYYGNGTARPVAEPVGTLSTRDRYALVRGDVDIEDVLFRMLEPHEIGRAMSFADSYVVLGSKRERVRQYGNAVTPNAAEVILCALVEAVTGEDIDRHAEPAAVAA